MNGNRAVEATEGVCTRHQRIEIGYEPAQPGRGECGVKVNFKQTLTLFKLAFQDWTKHNATRLGAALAFYTVWSIAPLVILAVAIASFAFSRSAAQGHLLDEVQSLVGFQGRVSVQAMLQHGQDFSAGILATIIGVVTLISGASGVFQELRSALNDIWETNSAASSGLWGMLREKLFSFGLVVSMGFVLLVSLIASACLAAVSKFTSGLLPLPAWSLAIFNELVSLVGISILFGAILKFVPACRVDWRDVRIGAFVTAVLFIIGKTALGWYLGWSTTANSYGAAGSLVVLVIWVYYSAQIFYYGAEFTHVHAKANRDVLPPAQKQEIQKKAA
jgi:membrane protein